MRLFGPNLRGTMTAAVVALALLTTLTAGALVALTTAVHSAGGRTAAAVESVHHTEEIQRDLLLHDRLKDQAARDQIASSLRDRMTDARQRVAGGSAEEQVAFANADRRVDAYLEAEGQDAIASRHAEAFAAIDQLLIQELGEARRARGTGYEVDDLANVIGAAVAATVILLAAILVWWLRTRALRPLLGLAQTMRRFGAGELEARAPSEGAAELSEMARQFNEMAGAIGRQRRDRQAFIGGVVHDLRTPLSVLRMSTDLVMSGAQLPPERMTKVLGTVARQVTRLERMAGDLLESVTLEAGQVTLRSEDVDARDLAVDVVQLYASSSSKHVLDVDLPEAPVPVCCDRMRLEQVLSNLLSNAIKYSPEGGRVSLSLAERAAEVVFTVRDEGIGMSETDASVAFEPFRRSKELEDAVPGSGLGLFIVRRLVEAHGGRIDLETEAGKGSTFIVRIPSAREPSSPRATRRPAPAEALHDMDEAAQV